MKTVAIEDKKIIEKIKDEYRRRGWISDLLLFVLTINTGVVASMQKAINTSKEDYTNLQNKLKEKVEKIEQISLENLRGKLNE